jgi:hypothetical protein
VEEVDVAIPLVFFPPPLNRGDAAISQLLFQLPLPDHPQTQLS